MMSVLKRRRYVVKKSFQFRYAAFLTVAMTLVAVLVGAILYLEIWSTVIPEFSEAKLVEKLAIAQQLRGYEDARLGRNEPRSLSIFREAKLLSAHERQVISDILANANAKLVPKVIVVIIAVVLLGLLVSHRIAGPVYRLGRSVEAVSKGDLTVHFRLRREDELQELAGSMEAMVRFLRGKIRHVRASVRNLREETEKARTALGESSEASSRLESCVVRLSEIERELNTFKLG